MISSFQCSLVGFDMEYEKGYGERSKKVGWIEEIAHQRKEYEVLSRGSDEH